MPQYFSIQPFHKTRTTFLCRHLIINCWTAGFYSFLGYRKYWTTASSTFCRNWTTQKSSLHRQNEFYPSSPTRLRTQLNHNMSSASIPDLHIASEKSTPLGHSPKLTNVPNPRTKSAYAHVIQLKLTGNEYVATVPTAFHTVCFNITGGLHLRQRLLITDFSNVELLQVIASNAGFRIMDHRSSSEYVLSRNGPMLFLYERFGHGEKCVVASVEPRNSLWSRKATVFVPDTNLKIGSLKRTWISKGMSRVCRTFRITSQPVFDIVMMIALQFCYQAVIDYV